jgi:hypothetical protein
VGVDKSLPVPVFVKMYRPEIAEELEQFTLRVVKKSPPMAPALAFKITYIPLFGGMLPKFDRLSV